MRIWVLAALVGISAPALADPSLEAGGFFGVDDFGSRIGLGRSDQPEQRPQTSPMFGARLTYIALPALAEDHDGGRRIGHPSRGWGSRRARGHLELAGELELALTPAWTGYGFDGPRPSYFSPVIGWRGDVMLRFAGRVFRPHVVVGGGGATVLSTSPYMTKQTDPVFLWGPGATFAMGSRWLLRIDTHQAVMPARGGGVTSTFELQVGIATAFGPASRPVATASHVEVADDHAEPDQDSDGDGIPDRLDKCPHAKETVNGVEDEDGCPEPDPDGDGIVGAADKCPDQPEDFDHFQDEDGCPDEDNDRDGIPDLRDACPNDPETKNGFEDDDGCPDQVPLAIAAALEGATAVRFEPNHARLTTAAKLALERTLAALRDHPALRVRVTAHPDAGGDELARKRADGVKWYLVEQGIVADQIVTAVGTGATPKGPVIELSLVAK